MQSPPSGLPPYSNGPHSQGPQNTQQQTQYGPPLQPGQQPSYGPPPSPSPWGYTAPPPARGVPVWVWVGLAVGVVGMFVLVGVFAIGMALGSRSGAAASADNDPSSSDGTGTAAPPSRRAPAKAPASNLPKPSRNIPAHDPSILIGCSNADLDLVEKSIGQAIDSGAPVYNAGDFQGCYTTYDRAALKLEVALSSSCKGPATALASGRANARGKSTPSDRAWAMRDTFDGLMNVIERSPN